MTQKARVCSSTFFFKGGFSSDDFQWTWRDEKIPDCMNANQYHEEGDSDSKTMYYAQLQIEKGTCLTEDDTSSLNNIICKFTGTQKMPLTWL